MNDPAIHVILSEELVSRRLPRHDPPRRSSPMRSASTRGQLLRGDAMEQGLAATRRRSTTPLQRVKRKILNHQRERQVLNRLGGEPHGSPTSPLLVVRCRCQVGRFAGFRLPEAFSARRRQSRHSPKTSRCLTLRAIGHVVCSLALTNFTEALAGSRGAARLRWGYAGVAQLVEHLTCTRGPWVLSPASGFAASARRG